jgi:thiamine pyrophosphate-dependent acetolactate synthase large subunit-like protein
MSDPVLHRRPLVAEILKDASDDLLVVAGLGQACYDTAAAGDRPRNFPLWGAMGGAAMIGLGLALAQPSKRVLVLTGDGEMLMGVGSFASIAAKQPANLAIGILDNERFGETGDQATHTAPRDGGPLKRGSGADLAAMAAACGVGDVGTVRTQAEVADAIRALLSAPGPVVRVLKVISEKLPFTLPPKDGAHLKERFRQAVLGHL